MNKHHEIKPVDRTKDIAPCDRRQDSMARLANGPNVCTAFSFIPENNKFYASNNTDDEHLIKKYMTFWKKYQVTKRYTKTELMQLIEDSMKGEQFLATQSLGLAGKRKELEQLESQEKDRTAELNQQMAYLEQLRQEENEAQLHLNDLMKDKNSEARCNLEKKIKDFQGELEKLSDKTAKLAKGRQIKNLKNQLQELPENPETTITLKNIENKKKLIEERERKIKELYTTNTIEIKLIKLKNQIEELERKLEKRRGTLFEKKLQKAMKKVLNWIKSFWKKSKKNKYNHITMDYEFCKAPVSNIVEKKKFASHAEMNVIQRIYEVTKRDLSKYKSFYVGISKSCCGRCINIINQIKEASARAAHCKPYPAGDPPFRKELKLKTIQESLKEEGKTIEQLSEETVSNREDYISSISLPSLNSDEDITTASITNLDLCKEPIKASMAKE